MEQPPVEGQAGGPVFTEEETRLIRLWALTDISAGQQVSAQAAYFATPAIFGIYGIVTDSLVILGVAFVSVLLLLVWGVVSTWREQRKSVLMQSICRKLMVAGEAPQASGPKVEPH